MTEFAFEVQRKAMNYALSGNVSKEEMFSDLKLMIGSMENKFDRFKLQGLEIVPFQNGHSLCKVSEKKTFKTDT